MGMAKFLGLNEPSRYSLYSSDEISSMARHLAESSLCPHGRVPSFYKWAIELNGSVALVVKCMTRHDGTNCNWSQARALT
jgi:hypothetical protein